MQCLKSIMISSRMMVNLKYHHDCFYIIWFHQPGSVSLRDLCASAVKRNPNGLINHPPNARH
jgi:hypothetical protein